VTRNWMRNYPRDGYPDLKRMSAIDETAALKSCCWGSARFLPPTMPLRADGQGLNQGRYLAPGGGEAERVGLRQPRLSRAHRSGLRQAGE
jgi:hypothetical protein